MTDLGNEAAGHGATGSPEQSDAGAAARPLFWSAVSGARADGTTIASSTEDDTWWASVFTRNYWIKNGDVKEKNCTTMDPESKQYARTVHEYADGALFITFNPGGQTHLARGEFLTVEGDRIDEFEIVNERGAEAAFSAAGSTREGG